MLSHTRHGCLPPRRAGRSAEQAAGGLPPGFAIHDSPQEFAAKLFSFAEGLGRGSRRGPRRGREQAVGMRVHERRSCRMRRPARRHNQKSSTLGSGGRKEFTGWPCSPPRPQGLPSRRVRRPARAGLSLPTAAARPTARPRTLRLRAARSRLPRGPGRPSRPSRPPPSSRCRPRRTTGRGRSL